MDRDIVNAGRKCIEAEEWWQRYSAMVRAKMKEAEVQGNGYAGSVPVTSGSGYWGSGSGSLGIRYIGSGSGSLGIRYVGSSSGSLGIRYIGSGSGSAGIRYIGSGSGSLGIRYIGSGSGSVGVRYMGSGSESSEIRYTGSNPVKEEAAPVPVVKEEPKKQDARKEDVTIDPYGMYPRSKFPGEGSGSQQGILGYGLGLI